MNVRSVAKAALLLVGTWVFAASTATAEDQGQVEQVPPLLAQKLGSAKGGRQHVEPRVCTANSIACGQTRSGSLTDDDCVITRDGSFFDAWFFSGTAGQTITASLTSSAFDAYLLLADPGSKVVAQDDNGGGGTNARIVFTLDSTGDWAVIANSLAGGETGPYTLTLSCSGGGGGTAPESEQVPAASSASSSGPPGV